MVEVVNESFQKMFLNQNLKVINRKTCYRKQTTGKPEDGSPKGLSRSHRVYALGLVKTFFEPMNNYEHPSPMGPGYQCNNKAIASKQSP